MSDKDFKLKVPISLYKSTPPDIHNWSKMLPEDYDQNYTVEKIETDQKIGYYTYHVKYLPHIV